VPLPGQHPRPEIGERRQGMKTILRSFLGERKRPTEVRGSAIVIAPGSNGLTGNLNGLWASVMRDYFDDLSSKGFVALIPRYFEKTSTQRDSPRWSKLRAEGNGNLRFGTPEARRVPPIQREPILGIFRMENFKQSVDLELPHPPYLFKGVNKRAFRKLRWDFWISSGVCARFCISSVRRAFTGPPPTVATVPSKSFTKDWTNLV
jgi:hypothetical protein